MAGLMGSLYTGNTGLAASSIGVATVGDNLANTNTTGFKKARAHFADLVNEYMVGVSGPNQIGRGVRLERIERLFTAGSFANTGVPTDMAISGDGFFVLRGTEAGLTENLYTRDGAFRFDEDGFLVSQSGSRVQGLNADGEGNLQAATTDVQLGATQLEPAATTAIEMHANLRPDDPINAFDPNDPENTSSFRTQVLVYDSLGNAHEMTVYGSRTGDGTWDMNGLVDGADVAGGVAGTPVQVPLGDLQFDQDGALLDENIADPVNVAWGNGASAGSFTFDFGDAINGEGGTGRAGSTQWNRVKESSTSFVSQDGYGTGELQGIGVDQNGVITGAYTNGKTLILAQVQTATFPDPTELNVLGGNNFVQSGSSGDPAIGSPQTGGRGSILSSTLELSNVEMASEFIDLIAYQRAFQANSRTISTADGLLQEVTQLLR
jgi:flagellar hook protein FlgE